MMENQEIQSIHQQINLYFDNELGKQDQEALKHKIDSDPVYNQVYTKELNFRNLIKSHAKRPNVSAHLIQSIKDKIRVL